MRKINFTKGYTLLFAVLFSAVVLVVSVSVLTISRKEVILSNTARDSQEAFYAADAGAECALYWDAHLHTTTDTWAFSTTVPSSSLPPVDCNGGSVSVARTDPGTIFGTYRFNFYYTLPGGNCANVAVYKNYALDSNTVLMYHTVIDSRGRNNSDCSNTANYPQQTVERGVRVTY